MFDMEDRMAVEEKRAWITLVVTVAAYALYAAVVARGASDGPLVDAPYVWAMIGTVSGAILVSIVLHIAVSLRARNDATRLDQRDKEIGRFGDHVGNSLVVVGAVAALLMAMAEWDHFWIANAVYLCLALSGVLGSIARVAAYRWGFQGW
ncbi:MAG: hypothetical protein ACFCVF_14885 [Kineosporiaceae bacterium]